MKTNKGRKRDSRRRYLVFPAAIVLAVLAYYSNLLPLYEAVLVGSVIAYAVYRVLRRSAAFRGYWDARPLWERALDILGVLMLLLALLSAPSFQVPLTTVRINPPQIFTPVSTLYFPFNVTNVVTFPPKGANATAYEFPPTACSHPPKNVTLECYYFAGFVKLSGKGGFSVGNAFTLNVTVNIPDSFRKVQNFTRIEALPYNALDPSLTLNTTVGIPNFVHIWLSPRDTTYGYTSWSGSASVYYSISGNQSVKFKSFGPNLNQASNPVLGTLSLPFSVEPSSVTEQDYTNTLGMSIAFVVLSLTFFSLRRSQPQTRHGGI